MNCGGASCAWMPLPKGKEDTIMNVKDIIENGSNKSTVLNSLEGQVDQFGGGTYNLFYKFSIYAAVIALMGAGIYLLFSNSGNRSEAKGKLLWSVLGVVLIFSAVGIVAALQTVGNGLFTNFGSN